jgi:hypothetical protein
MRYLLCNVQLLLQSDLYVVRRINWSFDQANRTHTASGKAVGSPLPVGKVADLWAGGVPDDGELPYNWSPVGGITYTPSAVATLPRGAHHTGICYTTHSVGGNPCGGFMTFWRPC